MEVRFTQGLDPRLLVMIATGFGVVDNPLDPPASRSRALY
jgi:hypothetical protein